MMMTPNVLNPHGVGSFDPYQTASSHAPSHSNTAAPLKGIIIIIVIVIVIVVIVKEEEEEG